MNIWPGDRVALRDRPDLRGTIVAPFPGVPGQWYVLLDGAPASIAYMDYWLRKLSLLELIAEAANE